MNPISLSIFVLFIALPAAVALQTMLTWRPGAPEEELTGYNLYEQRLGFSNYVLIASLGLVTNYLLTIPADGHHHAYIVTGVNAEGEGELPGCSYEDGPPVSDQDFCLATHLIFSPLPPTPPTNLTVNLVP